MGFPFLRRSSSSADLPASSARVTPFYRIPGATASTSDLPDLDKLSQSATPPPPFLPTPSLQKTGVPGGGAFGPKAGARFLASKAAQRAMRKADETEQNKVGDEFSIRDTIDVRDNGGLSTVTPSVPSVATARPPPPPRPPRPARRASSSGNGTSNSTSSGAGVRRVPVPSFDDTPPRLPSDPDLAGKNMKELTRKASQEEAEAGEEAARNRQASLSKATSAGLASPFASLSAAARAAESKKRRPPPVSGLNKAPLPEVDEQGRRVSTLFSTPRQRSASGSSRSSLTKDAVLSQLSEAIRRERKKAEMYERECRQSEVELDEINHNLDVLKEKYATSLEQQEQVMKSLEAQIEEVEHELEAVNDLDEETAERYLALLSSTSLDTLKARAPVVTAFDPAALTSSSTPPTPPSDAPTGQNKGVFSALAFKRALSLKRRVDTHVAAYDTVSTDIAVPKPPFPHRAEPSPTAAAPPFELRPRKLSKSRAPKSAAPSSEVAVQPAAPSPRPVNPPPPAPIFQSLASDAPSLLDAKPRPFPGLKSTKRAPPVSGLNRSKTALAASGESDTDTDGGVKGLELPERPRRRSRSDSLKRGLAGRCESSSPLTLPSHRHRTSLARR
ncbi:hypothetical protein JCM10207_005489 [Rhodosporidiobolus poonsookiae]